MLLSMKAVNSDFDSAPTLVATMLSFLNKISVGIPRIPYLRGSFLILVDIDLGDLEFAGVFPATSSSIGAITLHGPHHSAQ